MNRRNLLSKGAVCLGAIIALAWVMHWLGRVDYDTQPSAEMPSQPTAPIFNEADQALDEGRRWAAQNGVNRHQTCRTSLGAGLKALGCHRYVTENKHIPPLPNWRTQPTTRDCQAGVHAHWDPWLQDMAEKGEDRAVSSWTVRGLELDLRECNNIDSMRIVKVVHEPLARIEAMLAKLRAGHVLSETEKDQLRHDLPLVEDFREDELRSRYLALANTLFELAGGREQVFPLALLGSARDEQCAMLAQKVNRYKAAFHEAMAKPNLVSGHTNSAPEQAVLVARQDELLAIWTQAADDRLKMGCAPLR